ncbi:glutamate synthase-related protein [Salegentibacter echinorum]|uniref:glutamate synthase-related protein n=1 Tax=Salegentibacter echinorum TaxID=1073325 RepID=UPI00373FDBDB
MNLGAMSYGSISKDATLALNAGAKIASFAQNTGEGGLTPYHRKYKADLFKYFNYRQR